MSAPPRSRGFLCRRPRVHVAPLRHRGRRRRGVRRLARRSRGRLQHLGRLRMADLLRRRLFRPDLAVPRERRRLRVCDGELHRELHGVHHRFVGQFLRLQMRCVRAGERRGVARDPLPPLRRGRLQQQRAARLLGARQRERRRGTRCVAGGRTVMWLGSRHLRCDLYELRHARHDTHVRLRRALRGLADVVARPLHLHAAAGDLQLERRPELPLNQVRDLRSRT